MTDPTMDEIAPAHTLSRRSLLLYLGAGLSVALLAACGQGSAADSNAPGANGSAASSAPAPKTSSPTKVTIGYFPNVTHAPALVAAAHDAFRSAMPPGVSIDYKTFNAGPALIEALFGKAVDLGYVGPSPAVNGYVQSKGQALRIIAGAMSGGALFVVRPAANIKDAKDLSGKKIGSPQRGNTQDISLRFYLKNNGLKPRDEGGSVDVVPTANPDIVNLFKQGQIDGAWVPEPWASTIVQQAGGQVFLDERKLWPDGKFVTTNVVATTQLLRDRPDILAGFLKAHVEAVTFIVNHAAEARQTVGEQITRITTQALPAEIIESSFANQDVTYDPLVKTVIAQADSAYSLGFLGDSKPDLSNLFELGPLNAVLAAAGKAAVA